MKRTVFISFFQLLIIELLAMFVYGCENQDSNAYLPELTTTEVSQVTEASAQGGGFISSDAGYEITMRGVVWSTAQNPMVNLSTKTNNGTGIGSFSSSITGLSPSTTYYVRAYATNCEGTAYGAQISFMTAAVATVSTVTSPTGKVWMDRNLGASRVAISSTDTEAYGDLYQWGRGTDGHEKRTSLTTSTLSTSDTPGHVKFIIVNSDNYDWRNPQNNNLWQGENGTNNPCPEGFRIPTITEWEAERASWSSNNSSGAFASPLKLPVAGYRKLSDGLLDEVGLCGFYWSTTVNGTRAYGVGFDNSDVNAPCYSRAYGHSVRCIRDN
ncbi:MAG: FISUMP domain-containing protein [Paludibacter sp.]|nr:FISUMP domain-containing protein [Paludibacter sp.]